MVSPRSNITKNLNIVSSLCTNIVTDIVNNIVTNIAPIFQDKNQVSFSKSRSECFYKNQIRKSLLLNFMRGWLSLFRTLKK